MSLQFTLTGAMVDHLLLLQDDEILGKALCKLFNSKVKGCDLSCDPEEHKQLGFVIALLADDMRKAERNTNRMRTVRERLSNCSEQLPPHPEKETTEKESFPHTPYIEKESKEKDTHPSPSSHQQDSADQKIHELFEEFWRVYPKKKAKADALKAFVSLAKRTKDFVSLFNRMLDAVAIQSKSFDWIKSDGQFIPFPATWLRAERWNDIEVNKQEENNSEDINKLAEKYL